MSDLIVIERPHEHVALVRLNRPKVLNALSNALAKQLRTRKDFEYERRAAPRKLAEAILRNLEPGEFVRKTQRVPVRPLDPNTWRDPHGTTRWHPLSFRAAPRAPTPLTDGQEAAAE